MDARRMAERARKLEALALDQAGTPEGEAAGRLAREILARIDEEPGHLDSDPIDRYAVSLGGGEPWRRRLATIVGDHCSCRVAFKRGSGEAVFYGRRSGTRIAEYLLVVIERAILARASAAQPDGPLRRSYCVSAVLAVAARLEAVRSGEAATTTALVRQRSVEVDEWLAARGIRFGVDPGAPLHYSAEGYRAGLEIPLWGGVEIEPVTALPRGRA